MSSLDPNSRTALQFELKKSQSQILLNKVREHINEQRRSNSLKRTRFNLDMNTINSQLEFKHLNYIDETSDNDHQRLIDQCVKEILQQNKPLEQQDEFSPAAKLSHRSSLSLNKIASKRKLRKLPSTILVEKFVKAKGIQKKTVQQQQQDRLDQFIEQQRMYTEAQGESKIKLPQISDHTFRRRNIQIATNRAVSHRKSQSNLMSKDPSPLLFERQSTISMVSDSFNNDLSTIHQAHNSGRNSAQHIKIDQLIRQINEEKDEISTHQRSIRRSIAMIQRGYQQIDFKHKPEQKEKFLYLKYEQKIFGKTKQRPL